MKFIRAKTFKKNKSNRLVGFELECIGDRYPDEDRYGKYKSIEKFGWIDEDCSIEPNDEDEVGFEFKSNPSNGDDLLELISNINKKILKPVKAYSNWSCGFHVHLDVRSMSKEEKKNIRDWWIYLQPMFFSLVKSERKDCGYCDEVYRDISFTQWYDERLSLNIGAESSHGTYEVRIHHGTTHSREIRNWILLLIRFFDTFQHLSLNENRKYFLTRCSTEQKLKFFFLQTRCPQSLRKYYRKKFTLYQKGY